MTFLRECFTPIYHLFFPNNCQGCGQELLSNEKTICAACLSFMPKTKFHLMIHNPVEQTFFGRCSIEYATSMYYFNKDTCLQTLLHALKYQQKPEVGFLLGNLFAREIEDVGWLKDIDVIMPIPLSAKKCKARGYNQSECISHSLSAHLNIVHDTTSLIRTKHTESQTSKTRAERLSNMSNAFSVKNADAIAGKHILLVDDVITTGATLEECTHTILRVPNTKVSIATLAYAIE
ncbi:MAG: ComF family protein [Bacteroidetes bacterium]|nr:ComF family protein [Bacteroidota bacterium]MBP6316365.1 ComF family protein [Chitinophagaceae bacterium]